MFVGCLLLLTVQHAVIEGCASSMLFVVVADVVVVNVAAAYLLHVLLAPCPRFQLLLIPLIFQRMFTVVMVLFFHEGSWVQRLRLPKVGWICHLKVSCVQTRVCWALVLLWFVSV